LVQSGKKESSDKQVTEWVEKQWNRLIPPFAAELSKLDQLIKDLSSIPQSSLDMDSAVLTTKE
jgi:hypothetical protein